MQQRYESNNQEDSQNRKSDHANFGDFRAGASLPAEAISPQNEQWETAISRYNDFLKRGQNNLALAAAKDAWQIANSIFHRADLRVGRSHEILGHAYSHVGKYLLAEQYYQQALQYFQETKIDLPSSLVRLHNFIAWVQFQDQEYCQAEKQMLAALELLDQAKAHKVAPSIGCLANLSRILRAQDRLQESFQTFGQAYKLLEELPASEYNEAVSELKKLAAVCLEIERPEDAIIILKQARRYLEQSKFTDLTEDIELIALLGQAYLEDGQFNQSLQSYAEALDLLKKYPFFENQQADALRRHMAAILESAGYPERSERVLRRLLTKQQQNQSGNCPATISLRLQLALSMYESFNLPEAEKLARIAEQEARNKLPADLTTLLDQLSERNDLPEQISTRLKTTPLEEQAGLLQLLRERASAMGLISAVLASKAAATFKDGSEEIREQLLLEAADLIEKSAVLTDLLPQDVRGRSPVQLILQKAAIARLQGKELEYKSLCQEAFELSAPALSEKPSLDHAHTLLHLGEQSFEDGNYEDCQQRLEQALNIIESRPRYGKSTMIVQFLVPLARFRYHLEQHQEASELLERCQEILTSKGRDQTPLMFNILNLFSQVREAQGYTDQAEKLRSQAGAVFNQLDFLTDWQLFGDAPDVRF